MLRLALIQQTLHFKRPALTSRGALALRNLWIVQARDDRLPAVVGLGECGPIPGLSADATPSFPADAATLVDAINGRALPVPATGSWQGRLDTLLAPWDAPLALLPSLRFGLESALIDLFHGGRGACFDSAFVTSGATLPTHGLIWMDTPEGQLAQVAAKVAAGFSVIKMKVGGLQFSHELELLEEVRARFPAISLRLDANGAFAAQDALERIAALSRFAVEFLEQPIRAGQWQALRAICAESPIPIALDEELIGISESGEMHSLLETVRPHALIIKPSLLGGWRAAERLAALCERLGIAWWANSLLESSIGHDAICQWTAARGGGRVHGLGTGGLFRSNFPSPIRLVGCELQRDRADGGGQQRDRADRYERSALTD